MEPDLHHKQISKANKDIRPESQPWRAKYTRKHGRISCVFEALVCSKTCLGVSLQFALWGFSSALLISFHAGHSRTGSSSFLHSEICNADSPWSKTASWQLWCIVALTIAIVIVIIVVAIIIIITIIIIIIIIKGV